MARIRRWNNSYRSIIVMIRKFSAPRFCMKWWNDGKTWRAHNARVIWSNFALRMGKVKNSEIHVDFVIIIIIYEIRYHAIGGRAHKRKMPHIEKLMVGRAQNRRNHDRFFVAREIDTIFIIFVCLFSFLCLPNTNCFCCRRCRCRVLCNWKIWKKRGKHFFDVLNFICTSKKFFVSQTWHE